MNRIYRLVWNRAVGAVQVASEHAHGAHGGVASNAPAASPSRKPLALACMGLLGLAVVPTGAHAVSGFWALNTWGGSGGGLMASPSWTGGYGGNGGNVYNGVSVAGADGGAGQYLVDAVNNVYAQGGQGGAGGAAGNATDTRGGDGADGATDYPPAVSVLVGGGGGGGGAGYVGMWGTTGVIAVGTTVTGGQGGRGGDGGGWNPTVNDPVAAGAGGGGGAGGSGVAVDDPTQALVIDGTVLAGNGGAGGAAGLASDGPSAFGGAGGDGGLGVASLGNVAVGSSGQVTGGNGGTGGIGGKLVYNSGTGLLSNGDGGRGGNAGAGIGMYGTRDSNGDIATTLTNQGWIRGGNGAGGGYGGWARGSSWAGSGGSAGAGGVGAYVGNVAVENNNYIIGGVGGIGGAGGTLQGSDAGLDVRGGNGGAGGSGGAGLVGYASTIHNTGTIIGGGAGAGGMAGSGSVWAGSAGRGGDGGRGVVLGYGSSMVNDGDVYAGAGGEGGQGVAMPAGGFVNAGTGGYGGSGVQLEYQSTLDNNGRIIGGAGGNGGSFVTGSSGQQQEGSGGTGGYGGYGVIGSYQATVRNTGSIIGGAGGNGSAAASTAQFGNGGNGGTGGYGFIGSGGLLINTGTIEGGNGGRAGANAGAGSLGTAGAGGTGVSVYGNQTIINGGTISGGFADGGNGARADAVDLYSGNNRLELWNGYHFDGAVVSHPAMTDDVLALGGDAVADGGAGDGSFDLAGLGTDFVGFNAFEKSGTSTWTLTGQTNQLTAWTVSAGGLVLDNAQVAGSLAMASGTTATLSQNAQVFGASDSASGSDANGQIWGGNGGVGGAGGTGIHAVSGSEFTLVNAGTVTGGAGMSGGNANGAMGAPGSSMPPGIPMPGTNGSIGGYGGTGGAGGMGGDAIHGDGFTVTNTGVLLGGAGGDGGSANGGAGGYGGDGGSTITSMPAGNGGMGGIGGTGGTGGVGGAGGRGVFGYDFTLSNTGEIRGGNGGQGGFAAAGVGGAGGQPGSYVTPGSEGFPGLSGDDGHAGTTGAGGAGGVGLVSTGGSSVFNDGLIAGGLSADGTMRANAVEFSGGGNTLTLGAHYRFDGFVFSFSQGQGGDTLALGGAVDGSFDLSNIDSTIIGFTNFEKVDSSTWTLTGQGFWPHTWNLRQGGLDIAAQAFVTAVVMDAGTTLTNSGEMQGDTGAAGAPVVATTATDHGGMGATGGNTITATDATITNHGSVQGGDGGAGGSAKGKAGVYTGVPGGPGGTGSNGGVGGTGGTGGDALSGSGFTLVNEHDGVLLGGVGGTGGSAQGGNGATGGMGTMGGPGGNGGQGGVGGNGGNGGLGGTGGVGGSGVSGHDFTVINHGTIIGGLGGVGGTANAGLAGAGGQGGPAGGPSSVPGPPDPITGLPTTIWISGSTGPSGTAGSPGLAGTTGSRGMSGVGVVSTGGSSIFNDGLIGGNADASPAGMSNAVALSGGANTLTLGKGATFMGDVVSTSGGTNGGDTLALGGDIDATFDASKITNVADGLPIMGTTDTQFVGFAHFMKTGTSTWTLTGSTDATGSWLIDAGTLALGSDGSLASASGVTVHGTLDVAGVAGGTTTLNTLAGDGSVVLGSNTLVIANAHDTFSGVISGEGGLTVSGGTQTLTGANTYTGDTVITGGTLVLTGGGSLASAHVSSSGMLVFDHADTIVYAGAVSGSGGVVQSGAGLTILNGASDSTGVAHVTGGTLEIGDADHEGASWGGDATVDAGGTLRGHGTLFGNLTNNGIVRPGGSVGVLTVNGNYTQTAQGTLAIDVTPTSASQLHVLGTASLAGTLNLIYAPGTYTATNYTILTANQVTGTFGTVTSTNAPTGITSTVNYGANNVTLGLAGSGTGTGPTDPVDPVDPTGPTDPVTVAPADGALFANLQRAVGLQGQRNLVTVLDASLLAPTADCSTEPSSAQGTTRSGCLPGLWVQASGSNYQLDGSNRLDSTGFGINGGFDAAIGDAAHLGIQAGVGRINANDAEHGRGRVDTAHAGVYAFANIGPVVLSGVADAMFGDYHFNRATGIGEAASNPNGKAYSAALQLAWPMQFDSWKLTPKLGALYQHQSLDSFNETVNSSSELASAYGVSAKSSTVNTLQPYVSMAFGHAFQSGGITYVPQFELGYRYNTRGGTPTVTVAAEDGTIFALPANRLGKGTATAGARITATAGASWNLYLDYQGQFSGDLKDNAFTVGFTKHF